MYPPVCNGWSILGPVWSRLFDRLVAGAHFMFSVLDYAVRTSISEGWFMVDVALVLGFSWCAYLNRLSTAGAAR